MKKLYFALAAAVVALSASAAQRTFTLPADAKLITNDELAKSIIGKRVATPEQVATFEKQSTQKRIGITLGTSMEDAIGDFDCEYQRLVSPGGSVEGEAVLYWSDEYEDIEVELPDIPIAFGADWNSVKSGITFGQLSYGTAGAYYVYQIPVNGMTGEFYEELTVPYNNGYDFGDNGIVFAAVTAQGQVAGYYYTAGAVKLTRANGDYKVSVTADKECSADNTFNITITAGSDVAEIKLLDLPGDYKADANAAELFVQYGVTVAPGTYPLDLEGAVKETGYYCFMAASYDAEGNPVKYSSCSVIVTADKAEDWKTVAMIPYAGEFVNKYYDFNFASREVELQQNINTQVLRLVNPHKGAEMIHDDACEHAIYINVTDPTFVTVPFSPTGLDFGDGHLVVGTFGDALGYDKDACDERGLPYPTFSETRLISFPAKSLLAHESGYNEPGSWSYANSDLQDGTPGAFTFQLPALTLKVKVMKNGNLVSREHLTIGTTEVTSDTQGEVNLTLPYNIHYFDTLPIRAGSIEKQIKLNGAKNEYTFVMDESGVDDVAVDAAGVAEYFNLQGVRVENPAQGQVVIKVQNGKATKTIVK